MVSGTRFLPIAVLVSLILSVCLIFGTAGCDLRGCESKETDSPGELEETDSRYELKESDSLGQQRDSRESYSRGEFKEPVSPEQRDRYRRFAAELAKLKERMPPPGPCRPVIDATPDGIRPMSGKCGTVVTLRGECFGEKQGGGYSVQLMNTDVWIDTAIRSWADTLIVFDTPCETLQPGNYRVRVVTPTGTSNIRLFTLFQRKREWSDAFKEEK